MRNLSLPPRISRRDLRDSGRHFLFGPPAPKVNGFVPPLASTRPPLRTSGLVTKLFRCNRRRMREPTLQEAVISTLNNRCPGDPFPLYVPEGRRVVSQSANPVVPDGSLQVAFVGTLSPSSLPPSHPQKIAFTGSPCFPPPETRSEYRFSRLPLGDFRAPASLFQPKIVSPCVQSALRSFPP